MTLNIRPFTAEDAAAVYHVHEQAFDGRDEADLVQALHEAGAAVLSMVAEMDGEMAGHILYTALDVEPKPESPRMILALAPLAVLPKFQRAGAGSALIQESLARLRDRGADAVIVLGHPDYYPKFGFTPASEFGIAFPGAVPDEAFMALPLREGGLDGCAGTVVYHEAFGLDVG